MMRIIIAMVVAICSAQEMNAMRSRRLGWHAILVRDNDTVTKHYLDNRNHLIREPGYRRASARIEQFRTYKAQINNLEQRPDVAPPPTVVKSVEGFGVPSATCLDREADEADAPTDPDDEAVPFFSWEEVRVRQDNGDIVTYHLRDNQLLLEYGRHSPSGDFFWGFWTTLIPTTKPDVSSVCGE
ncbi:MAG: hypothetical protein LBR89_02805 [Holosporales bacterium]|jgi:hypothetical protein|nr:hypothetical protein [Holosporales bacterium]